jgi:uridine phosphorylase
MAWDIPLTEFDAHSPALIDPLPVPTLGEVPEHAVICCFRDVIDEVCGNGRAEIVRPSRGSTEATSCSASR